MRRAVVLLVLLAAPVSGQPIRAGGDVSVTVQVAPGVSVELPLEGVDLDMRDAEMATPLHRAAQYSDDAALIHAMIARGARVDARDARGRTPLHYAAEAGAPPAVLAALLGARDARDMGGLTALHLAAGPQAAALLTLAGADACATDAKGRPALDAAMLEAIRIAAPDAYPAARAAWLGCL